MMERPSLILLLTFLAALFSGCGSPEDDLLGHVESVTRILEENMDDPGAGIEEIEAYLSSNLPAISESLSSLVVELYEIDDPSDLRERVEEVRDSMKEPVEKLVAAVGAFERKLDRDPVGRRALKRIEKRLEAVGEAFGALEAKHEPLPPRLDRGN